MSEDKLYRLYELVIREKDLRTSILNENGFDSEDIRSLCSVGVLEKIKCDEYKFKNVDDLFFYGLNLVNLGNREIGIACLEECLELESSLLDTYLNVFLYSLKAKDYDTAYVFLESFYEHCPNSREYLFMLNFIKRAPITLEDEVRRVKENRKVLEHNRSSNSNSIHTLIISCLNDEVDIRVKSKLNGGLKKVHNKKYLKFIESYNEVDEIRPLGRMRKIAVYIAQAILDIENTHEIPRRTSTNENTVYDAVRTNNFKRALELNIDNLEKKGIKLSGNIINVLLTQIVELIEALEKEKSDVNKCSEEYLKQYKSKSRLVYSSLNRVYEKGVALLDPMNVESIMMIYEIVENIPHVEAMEIGEGELKRVVLKLSYPQYIDVMQKIKEAKIAKDNWQTELSIEKNLEILKAWELTGAVCANLGLLFIRMDDIKTAKEYLTIATIVSRKEKELFDFSDLLCCLNEPDYIENIKPQTEVDIEEFQEDSYFGIQSPQEKIDIVLCGEPVETVRKAFNLDDDELARVYIISARECYKEGDISRGDELLKVAERLPKAKETNKYLMEVRKNKKFYKMRNAGSEVPVIKPVN